MEIRITGRFRFCPRPILQPSFELNRQDAMQPCDETKDEDRQDVKNADLAVEIGKFALRRGEHGRGYCWINHGAFAGSIRAQVLLGVIHLMGWRGPIDNRLAYRFFDGAYFKRDPWAAYFLDRCYREGIGTAVNNHFSLQIESSALLGDEAQRVLKSIGADDLEKQRQAELAALSSDSDIYYKICDGAKTKQQNSMGEFQHCSNEVNQKLLQEKTNEINDKYARIK
jgi:TPR repeat protein